MTQQYDLARLDLHASFTQAVCLVEWPERLGAQQQPAGHLAVHISILEQAEQQRMQQQRQQEQQPGQEGQGQQQQKQQAAGSLEASSSSSSSSDSSGGEGQEEEEDDGDEEGSGDARWRRIELSSGSQRWQPRLQLLRRYLEAEGAELGCYLLSDSGEGAL